MQFLDLTLPSAAENLALDEALLDDAEARPAPAEVLRLWEPERPAVVIGRSSRAEIEVRLDVCHELGIPVLRRASGGAAVVIGPGCLMYALVLSYERRPFLRNLSDAHRFVLARHVEALAAQMPGVRCQGTSDLAIGEMKFSGNSARCRRRSLLYHGTFFYDFPVSLVDRCLKMPPRMPSYRAGRPHGRFVTNVPLGVGTIRRTLIDAWQAGEPYGPRPEDQTAKLAAEKYGRREWNEGLGIRD